jgi:fructosamine-3-kinase
MARLRQVTPFLDYAVETRQLAGGTHHQVWLATQADGSRLVVKATPSCPAGMFTAEAEGLAVLRDSGTFWTPRVVDVGADFLVLEALEALPGPEDAAFWESAGRALARLHSIGNDQFGWSQDNWLGPTRQVNTWTVDGYEFFARHRLLRYLAEPAVAAVLTAADRSAIERICARLPELLPLPRPALTHGDLWPGNMLATTDGTAALIDPAVSWNWPGVDVSMMLYSGVPTPGRFFDAYHELRPPEPGWRDQLRLLHLRELLCVLSQGDTRVAARVLDLVNRYR